MQQLITMRCIFLLQNGATFNEDALYIAAKHHQEGSVKKILQYAKGITPEALKRALMLSVQHDICDQGSGINKALLAYAKRFPTPEQRNLQAPNAQGVTPLMHACNHGYHASEAVASLLSDEYANPLVDNRGFDAMYYAVRSFEKILLQ